MLLAKSFRLLPILALFAAGAVAADEPKGFLETIHHHTTLTSTAIENGDVNPYAIVVAPVTAGTVEKDDVLVDNFNDISNLQGTGTTIVDYNPTTKQIKLFAKLPKQVKECPGGVGLTTAMTMLKSGWVIVGSTPSTDGTTRTKGQGCLMILDSSGKLVKTITGPKINGPWGNVALIDNGSTASIFVSNAGFDVPGPEVHDPDTGRPVIVKKSTVLRIDLDIPSGKPPQIKGQTIVADGLGSQANKDSFMIGPTGIAITPDGKTLYISDAVGNRILAIDEPMTRTASAGQGRVITEGQLLHRPLAMIMTPEGHLLVTNANNGQVVEVDPRAGKQLYAQWIDTDQAQSPPGNGDLFGIALSPDGKGFYYVEDDMNTLVKAE